MKWRLGNFLIRTECIADTRSGGGANTGECMEGGTDTDRSLLSNIGKKGCVSALVWAHLSAPIGPAADTPNQSMRTQ